MQDNLQKKNYFSDCISNGLYQLHVGSKKEIKKTPPVYPVKVSSVQKKSFSPLFR